MRRYSNDHVFDGVRLEEGPAWQRWLTLAVLAAVMAALTSMVDVWGSGMAIVLVAVVGLLLWLLTWLSKWLDLTLSVSGFWPFAVTALGLSLATWPGRLVRRNENPPPEPDPFFDDPFFHSPMGPFR